MACFFKKNRPTVSNMENPDTGAIKKATIEIIKDSWKKINEVNKLEEHGVNVMIRFL